MASHTSITDLMNMTVLRFYETWHAIRSVCERRKKQLEESRK